MINKKCVICKNVFETSSSRKITCSKECYNKLRYQKIKKRGKFKNNCIFCGKFFTSTKKGTKYCSIACSNSNREPLKYNFGIKICNFCGKEFQAKTKRSSFCSNQCLWKDSREQKKKQFYTLVCEQCGKEYTVNKNLSKTRFCSNSCSRVAMHESMSEEQKIEWKNKISQSNTGNIFSEERKEEYKIKFSGENNPMFGKEHSLETKEMMSLIMAEKILNGEINYFNSCKSGNYFSSKLNKEIHYRSSWEETAYKKLDADDNVTFYTPEPFSIEYLFEGCKRHYIPDLLIIYRDGTQKLVEIKPECFLDAQINQAKFTAAQEHCSSRGLLFEIWTEKDIN